MSDEQKPTSAGAAEGAHQQQEALNAVVTDDALDVQGLLVCREVQRGQNGVVSLREVIEIVPVIAFPGEAGPLAFAAFVRPHRPGEAAVSFRIHPMGHPDKTLLEMPGRLVVQKGFEGRQTVISAGFRTMTIHAGGWFVLEFRIGQRVLARTRFAVGAVTKQAAGTSSGGAAPAK